MQVHACVHACGDLSSILNPTLLLIHRNWVSQSNTELADMTKPCQPACSGDALFLPSEARITTGLSHRPSIYVCSGSLTPVLTLV